MFDLIFFVHLYWAEWLYNRHLVLILALDIDYTLVSDRSFSHSTNLPCFQLTVTCRTFIWNEN